MSVKKMFHDDLINLFESAASEVELFQKVAETLYEKGYVTEDYKQGLVNRESNYPTGLATQFLNIALPHTDTIFIKKPFIYIARIKQPVIVRQMGDNREIGVRHFLFLGIKEPSKQVGLLQLLMELFQDKHFVEKFKTIDDVETMYQLFINKTQESEVA